jgi:hypothetical protein
MRKYDLKKTGLVPEIKSLSGKDFPNDSYSLQLTNFYVKTVSIMICKFH